VLVLPIRGTHAALPYVLFHHERWDGTGYPSGIRGRAILKVWSEQANIWPAALAG
jgi:hypothetical protein